MSRKRIDMLLAQFDPTLGKEWWFAPFERALAGVTPEHAAWSPGGGVNTIWQTINHVTFWKLHFAGRMEGAPHTGEEINNDSTFDTPGNPNDAAGWNAAVGHLREASLAVRKAIARLEDADLDRPLPGDSAPLGEILAGMVLHDGYHIGQIVLIRKWQGSWTGMA